MSDVLGWVARTDGGPITVQKYHSNRECAHLAAEQEGGHYNEESGSAGYGEWIPNVTHFEVTQEVADLIGLTECRYCQKEREKVSLEDFITQWLAEAKTNGSLTNREHARDLIAGLLAGGYVK